MPLQKQNVPVNLKGGLGNKDDDFLHLITKCIALKDAVFSRRGTIERRDGYTSVTKTLISGSNSPGSIGRRMWAHKSQILIESETGLHELIRNGTQSGTVNGSIEKNAPFSLTVSNPTTPVKRKMHRAGISYTEVGAGDSQDQIECDYARDENFQLPGGAFLYTGELECFVWLTDDTNLNAATNRRTAHVLVRNRNSGAVVFEDTLNGSGVSVAEHPRVIAVYPGGYASGTATRFYLFWTEVSGGTANLKYSYIDTSAPGSRTANATLVSGLQIVSGTTSTAFDVWYDPGSYTTPVDKLCYAYQTAAATHPILAYAAGTAPQTLLATSTLTTVAAIMDAVSAYIFVPTSGVHQYVMLFREALNLHSFTVDFENTSTQTHTTISTIADGRATLCKNPASDKMLVFYDVNPFPAGEAFPHAVYVQGLNPTGTVDVDYMPLAASVVVAGRPFMLEGTMNATRGRFEGGRLNLPVALLSAFQPTAFIVEVPDSLQSISLATSEKSSYLTPNILARICPGEHQGYTTIQPRRRLPGQAALGGQFDSSGASSANTTAAFPVLKLGQLYTVGAATDAAAVQLHAHTVLAELDLNAELMAVPIGQGNTFLTGAMPRIFDGDKCFEAGFNYFPEGLSATHTNDVGQLTNSGVYSMVVCYEWQDRSGKLHRSAPSTPLTVTIGAGDDTILLKFPFLRLTERGSGDAGTPYDLAGNVRLVVYRTTAGGSIYYRDPSDPGNTAAAGVSDFVNRFFSTTATAQQALIISDTNLVRGEQLYTTGGALANTAFPSCDAVTVYQNRLWMNDKAHPQTIRFTDEADDDDFAVATNEAYVISVPGDSGAVNTLAVMDEKLIAFTERQGYVTAGSAPNRLGTNNGLSPFQGIANSFGARSGNPGATVVTPDGLFFLTKLGFRMLDRGLQIARDEEGTFVGSNTDDVISQTAVYRSLDILDRNQVRLGDLVYDTHFRQWSQFTNHTWAGWCISPALGMIFFYKADGTVYYTPTQLTSASPYQDNGTDFSWYLETAWLKQMPQGFQRVYALQLLGRPSLYNPSGGLTSVSLKVNVAFDYDNFNASTDEIATGLPASGLTANSGAFQLEHKLSRQKCETMRFKISEVSNTAGGFDLTNISFLLGLKPGLNRLPSAKRF
jgi:hypothetical protein